ncbi:N-glycosylase/DNA lyase [Bacillus rossius redtenbacheri]|uniref:N-glycosylase/DNA lyase n=1 Tax=Bacillus rossius redtenbacheri TaxID=93214 RepID=UPI002FDEF814
MWKKLPCSKSELQLLYTLTGGQCFRWKSSGENEWTGVFGHAVWTLSQDDTHVLYRVTSPADRAEDPGVGEGADASGGCTRHLQDDTQKAQLLRKYFRLDESLQELYCKWSQQDPHFKQAAVKFQGVRILAQDPVENLFSFICSSNNNISRISSMVEKLCVLYGEKIATVGDTVYHAFPVVSALASTGVEKALRNAGFGYRAKFIHQSACKIEEMGGDAWLGKLQELPYVEAKAELMKLPGIGAKVADCICLMSLNHLESIPVDTHIFQVASQRYMPHLKKYKSVTAKVYDEIGDYFRDLYGVYAGWAHTILFCADLKMFQQDTLSTKSAGSVVINDKNKRRKTAA